MAANIDNHKIDNVGKGRNETHLKWNRGKKYGDLKRRPLETKRFTDVNFMPNTSLRNEGSPRAIV
jgi:hypothetical protein